MSQEILFVITPKSEMERWEINRSKLNINDAMINGLTAGMVRKLRTVIPMQLIHKDASGCADLAIGPNGYSVVRMPVYEIPLTAPFAVSGTTVFPEFDGSHPIMNLKWKVPPSMFLFLCAHINNSLEVIEVHLAALDSSNRCWGLPISNLYADCRLCPGRYNTHGHDVVDCARKAWGQFIASSWNADLYNDAGSERRAATKAMFGFDVEGDQFVQRPVKSQWWEFCEKASTEFITNYLTY